jgi:hypothetical protein
VSTGGPNVVYLVPASGLPAWDAPGPVRRLVTELPPGAEVRLIKREGDWALVEYTPGSSAWVDARLLPDYAYTPEQPSAEVAQPAQPPGAAASPAGRPPKRLRNRWWPAIAAVLVAVVVIVVIVVATRPKNTAARTVATQITSVTSTVRHGSKATLQAITTAGASCSITVTYTTGRSHASGLKLENADSNGNVHWTWVVGARTKPGTFPIKVTCNPGGSATSQITTT